MGPRALALLLLLTASARAAAPSYEEAAAELRTARPKLAAWEKLQSDAARREQPPPGGNPLSAPEWERLIAAAGVIETRAAEQMKTAPAEKKDDLQAALQWAEEMRRGLEKGRALFSRPTHEARAVRDFRDLSYKTFETIANLEDVLPSITPPPPGTMPTAPDAKPDAPAGRDPPARGPNAEASAAGGDPLALERERAAREEAARRTRLNAARLGKDGAGAQEEFRERADDLQAGPKPSDERPGQEKSARYAAPADAAALALVLDAMREDARYRLALAQAGLSDLRFVAGRGFESAGRPVEPARVDALLAFLRRLPSNASAPGFDALGLENYERLVAAFLKDPRHPAFRDFELREVSLHWRASCSALEAASCNALASARGLFYRAGQPIPPALLAAALAAYESPDATTDAPAPATGAPKKPGENAAPNPASAVAAALQRLPLPDALRRGALEAWTKEAERRRQEAEFERESRARASGRVAAALKIVERAAASPAAHRALGGIHTPPFLAGLRRGDERELRALLRFPHLAKLLDPEDPASIAALAEVEMADPLLAAAVRGLIAENEEHRKALVSALEAGALPEGKSFPSEDAGLPPGDAVRAAVEERTRGFWLEAPSGDAIFYDLAGRKRAQKVGDALTRYDADERPVSIANARSGESSAGVFDGSGQLVNGTRRKDGVEYAHRQDEKDPKTLRVVGKDAKGTVVREERLVWSEETPRGWRSAELTVLKDGRRIVDFDPRLASPAHGFPHARLLEHWLRLHRDEIADGRIARLTVDPAGTVHALARAQTDAVSDWRLLRPQTDRDARGRPTETWLAEEVWSQGKGEPQLVGVFEYNDHEERRIYKHLTYDARGAYFRLRVECRTGRVWSGCPDQRGGRKKPDGSPFLWGDWDPPEGQKATRWDGFKAELAANPVWRAIKRGGTVIYEAGDTVVSGVGGAGAVAVGGLYGLAGMETAGNLTRINGALEFYRAGIGKEWGEVIGVKDAESGKRAGQLLSYATALQAALEQSTTRADANFFLNEQREKYLALLTRQELLKTHPERETEFWRRPDPAELARARQAALSRLPADARGLLGDEAFARFVVTEGAGARGGLDDMAARGGAWKTFSTGLDYAQGFGKGMAGGAVVGLVARGAGGLGKLLSRGRLTGAIGKTGKFLGKLDDVGDAAERFIEAGVDVVNGDYAKMATDQLTRKTLQKYGNRKLGKGSAVLADRGAPASVEPQTLKTLEDALRARGERKGAAKAEGWTVSTLDPYGNNARKKSADGGEYLWASHESEPGRHRVIERATGEVVYDGPLPEKTAFLSSTKLLEHFVKHAHEPAFGGRATTPEAYEAAIRETLAQDWDGPGLWKGPQADGAVAHLDLEKSLFVLTDRDGRVLSCRQIEFVGRGGDAMPALAKKLGLAPGAPLPPDLVKKVLEHAAARWEKARDGTVAERGEEGADAPPLPKPLLEAKVRLMSRLLERVLSGDPELAHISAMLGDGKTIKKVRFAEAGELEAGVNGGYYPATGEILLSRQYAEIPSTELAQTLAHELQHLYDFQKAGTTSADRMVEFRGHKAGGLAAARIEAALAKHGLNKDLATVDGGADNPRSMEALVRWHDYERHVKRVKTLAQDPAALKAYLAKAEGYSALPDNEREVRFNQDLVDRQRRKLAEARGHYERLARQDPDWAQDMPYEAYRASLEADLAAYQGWLDKARHHQREELAAAPGALAKIKKALGGGSDGPETLAERAATSRLPPGVFDPESLSRAVFDWTATNRAEHDAPARILQHALADRVLEPFLRRGDHAGLAKHLDDAAKAFLEEVLASPNIASMETAGILGRLRFTAKRVALVADSGEAVAFRAKTEEIAAAVKRGDLVGAEKAIATERARLRDELGETAYYHALVGRLEQPRKELLHLDFVPGGEMRALSLETAARFGLAKKLGRFQELGAGDQKARPDCVMRAMHQLALQLRESGHRIPSELLRFEDFSAAVRAYADAHGHPNSGVKHGTHKDVTDGIFFREWGLRPEAPDALARSAQPESGRVPLRDLSEAKLLDLMDGGEAYLTSLLDFGASTHEVALGGAIRANGKTYYQLLNSWGRRSYLTFDELRFAMGDGGEIQAVRAAPDAAARIERFLRAYGALAKRPAKP